jgi:hypothetical protein
MTGGLTAPTLPELMTVGCPHCQEEGCETCAGSGQLEVCGGCWTVPMVRGGFDACGCKVAVELGRVA